MERCFKYIINLLLVLVAFQVFNLNTAECTASVNDGSVTLNHTITYIAKRCWDRTFEHQHHCPASHDQNNHHKAWKKFFPSGLSVAPASTAFHLLVPEEGLQHFATATGYSFQYFRPINPPPPKAFA